MATPLEDLIAEHRARFPEDFVGRLTDAMQDAYDMGRENGLDAAAGAS